MFRTFIHTVFKVVLIFVLTTVGVVFLMGYATSRDKERASAQPAIPLEGTRDRLAYDVEDTLGSSNRDVEKVQRISFNKDRGFILIRFSIGDNLTDGMIKLSARRDICRILQAVACSGYPYQTVDVHGTFSLSDRFGNSKEEIVVKATYRRPEIERINWDRFDFNNVYFIGKDVWTHPAFREE